MIILAFIASCMVIGCVSLTVFIFRGFGAGAMASLGCLLFVLWLAQGLAIPPAALASLALFVACLTQVRRQAQVGRVVAVGLIGLVVAMAGGAILSGSYLKGIRHLRESYPVVSLSSRLAYEAPPAAGRDLRSTPDPHARFGPPPKGTPAWAVLDSQTDLAAHHGERRGRALEEIHASTVEQFVNAPGFGVTRMSSIGEWSVRSYREPAGLLPGTVANESPSTHPGVLRALPPPSVHRESKSADPLEGELWESHHRGLVDFFDSDDFGWVVDRDHVAGFLPHRFSSNFRSAFASEPAKWQLQRLELVSLRRFTQPMVYVTGIKLPQMDKIQNVPTRELNTFEAAALESLAKGEELLYELEGRRVLALGALRAREQCTKCHDVKRGALLGAFSYEFLGDAPPPKPPL
jgi:hypothetical protein